MIWKISKLFALQKKPIREVNARLVKVLHFPCKMMIGSCRVGVLTKPDTIPPGAMGKRQLWKDILQGQTKPMDTLKHGYYCVRLPDDDERARKISRAESQKLAAEFFDTTLPWSSIPERNRFGIPNFVSDISQLLVGLIESK